MEQAKEKPRFKQTEIGAVPEDWDVKELKELTELITDGKHGDCKNQLYSGYYFLSAKDVFDGRLDYSDAREITKEDFVDTHKRTCLEAGDVLLSNSGTIGRLAVAEEAESTKRTTFQKSVAVIKPNKILLDSFFLYYYFLANVRRVKETAGGTTQQNLLLKDLRTFKIAIPLLIIQREQVKPLRLIDTKIELNRKMNLALEAVGQAVFKRWFVDFEFPNEESKPYKSSGGEMDYRREMGKDIPKGWTASKLGAFIYLDKGLSYKGAFLSDQGLPMINLGTIAPIAGFIPDGIKHYTGEYKERHLVAAGDIVIANTDITQKREVLGSPAIVPPNLNCEKALFTHHIFAVRKKANLPTLFIYYLLQLQGYRDRVMGFATGTTVLALPRDAILDLEFAVPDETSLRAFERIVSLLMVRINANIEQNKSLTQIRDMLLPKLMSGKIRVPILKEQVEEG